MVAGGGALQYEMNTGVRLTLPKALVNTISNKAVLEPRVSPAFAITYFCNHCNIRFENTSKYVDTLTFFQKLESKVIDP